MEKLKELVEKELQSMEESGIDSGNIDVIYKLVDIHKDIANEEYWKAKKEAMEMRYRGDYEEYDEDYGRRRRDSRGRYMDGRMMRDERRGRNYGHHMPEMYWERMMDGMDGYMEGREQYERGNYGGKDQSIESLEKMLDGTFAFVEDILQNPEQKEEHKIVRHYIGKFQELL